MGSNPIIDDCLAPLVGLPCWQVKPGYGTFITLEFGDPHLEIREPKGTLTDRAVTVRGAWHLWIYCCSWTIDDPDGTIGTAGDNNRLFRQATSYLDGQALTCASVTSDACSTFRFDLGGSLTTQPYNDDGEQWMLFQPNGDVLVVRADGMFSNELSSEVHPDSRWRPIEP